MYLIQLLQRFSNNLQPALVHPKQKNKGKILKQNIKSWGHSWWSLCPPDIVHRRLKRQRFPRHLWSSTVTMPRKFCALTSLWFFTGSVRIVFWFPSTQNPCTRIWAYVCIFCRCILGSIRRQCFMAIDALCSKGWRRALYERKTGSVSFASPRSLSCWLVLNIGNPWLILLKLNY